MKKSIVAVLCILLSLMLFSCSPSPAAPPDSPDAGGGGDSSGSGDTKIVLHLSGPRKGKQFSIIIDGAESRYPNDTLIPFTKNVAPGKHTLAINMLDYNGNVVYYMEAKEIIVPAGKEWTLSYDFWDRPVPGAVLLQVEPDVSGFETGSVKIVKASLKSLDELYAKPIEKCSPSGYVGVIYWNMKPGRYELTLQGLNAQNEVVSASYSEILTLERDKDITIYPVLKDIASVPSSRMRVNVTNPVPDSVLDIVLYDAQMQIVPGDNGYYPSLYNGHYVLSVTISKDETVLASENIDVFIGVNMEKVVNLRPEIKRAKVTFDMEVPEDHVLKLSVDGKFRNLDSNGYVLEMDEGHHTYSIETIDRFDNLDSYASGSFDVVGVKDITVTPTLSKATPTKGAVRLILCKDPRINYTFEATVSLDGVEKDKLTISGLETEFVYTGLEQGEHEIHVECSGTSFTEKVLVSSCKETVCKRDLAYETTDVHLNIVKGADVVKVKVHPRGYSPIWVDSGFEDVVLHGIIPGAFEADVIGYDKDDKTVGRSFVEADITLGGTNTLNCTISDVSPFHIHVKTYEEKLYFDYFEIKFIDNQGNVVVKSVIEGTDGFVALPAGKYHEECKFYTYDGKFVGTAWGNYVDVPTDSELEIVFNAESASVTFNIVNPVEDYEYTLVLRNRYGDNRYSYEKGQGTLTRGCIETYTGWIEARDADGILKAHSDRFTFEAKPCDQLVINQVLKTGSNINVDIQKLGNHDSYTLEWKPVYESSWHRIDNLKSGIYAIENLKSGIYDIIVRSEVDGVIVATTPVLTCKLMDFVDADVCADLSIHTANVTIDTLCDLYLRKDGKIKKYYKPESLELEAGTYEYTAVASIYSHRHGSSGAWKTFTVNAGENHVLDIELKYEEKPVSLSTTVNSFATSSNVLYEIRPAGAGEWYMTEPGGTRTVKLPDGKYEIRARLYLDSSHQKYLTSETQLIDSGEPRYANINFNFDGLDTSLTFKVITDPLEPWDSCSVTFLYSDGTASRYSGKLEDGRFTLGSVDQIGNKIRFTDIESICVGSDAFVFTPDIVLDRDNFFTVEIPRNDHYFLLDIHDTWPRYAGDEYVVDHVNVNISSADGKSVSYEVSLEESKHMKIRRFSKEDYDIVVDFYNAAGKQVGHGERRAYIPANYETKPFDLYIASPNIETTLTIELTGIDPGLYPKGITYDIEKPVSARVLFKEDSTRPGTFVGQYKVYKDFDTEIRFSDGPNSLRNRKIKLIPGHDNRLVIPFHSIDVEIEPPSVVEPLISISAAGVTDYKKYYSNQDIRFTSHISALGLSGEFTGTWMLDGAYFATGLETSIFAGPDLRGVHEFQFIYTDKNNIYTQVRYEFEVIAATVPTEGGNV